MTILPGETHIWAASLNTWAPYAHLLEGKLSCDERKKASNYLFEKDKNYYVVSRYLLRKIIGSYLNLPCEYISFGYGEYGKPFIDPLINDKSLCFNLSHSKDMVMFIFSMNRFVGIDLEYTEKGYKGGSIIDRWFTLHEQSSYHRLPKEEQKRFFYHAWTTKEAYLKGLGKGITIPLDDIELIFDREEGKFTYQYQFKNQIEGLKWNLNTFIPFSDYISSYAIRSCNIEDNVKWWDLTGNPAKHGLDDRILAL